MMTLCCKVLEALRGKTLVSAESLTGGGIGAALTAVPGSSEVYKGATAFNGDGSFDAAIALIDKGDINCCGGKIGENKLFTEDEEAQPTDAQQGIAQPFGGTAQSGAQPDNQGGAQSSEQAAEPAVENTTPAKEEKPKAPKGPSKFNKFWTKLKGAATRIVSEEEDQFSGTKED